MKCENAKCNNQNDGTFGSGRFCSKSCSCSKVWTDADKKLKSESAKASNKVKLANKKLANKNKKYNRGEYIVNCPMCGNEFNSFNFKYKPRVYCSNKCRHGDNTYKFRPKPPGGYRKGSGIGKSGWYKGVWCDSSYELCYLMYCLDHNIPISRNTERFTYIDSSGISRYYLPDFIVGDNNQLIEIKGYKEKNFDLKMESCPDVRVLFKSELVDEFEYVHSTYGKDFINYYE